MKKTFAVLFAFVLLLAALGINASAAGTVVNSGTIKSKDITWELTSDGTLTISGTGTVSQTSGGWGKYRTDIKSLVIEEGVTTVEKSAFAGYESLQSVTIPDSVTKLGNGAFYKCYSLETVVIGDGVVSFELERLFTSGTALVSLTLGSGITDADFPSNYFNDLAEVNFSSENPVYTSLLPDTVKAAALPVLPILSEASVMCFPQHGTRSP